MYILFGLSGEGADTITKNGGCVIVDMNTMKHLIFQQQLKTGKASTSDSAIIRIFKIWIFYAESFTSFPKHWLCPRCFAYYLFTFFGMLVQRLIVFGPKESRFCHNLKFLQPVNGNLI